jgi:hypothetical protein
MLRLPSCLFSTSLICLALPCPPPPHLPTLRYALALALLPPLHLSHLHPCPPLPSTPVPAVQFCPSPHALPFRRMLPSFQVPRSHTPPLLPLPPPSSPSAFHLPSPLPPPPPLPSLCLPAHPHPPLSFAFLPTLVLPPPLSASLSASLTLHLSLPCPLPPCPPSICPLHRPSHLLHLPHRLTSTHRLPPIPQPLHPLELYVFTLR